MKTDTVAPSYKGFRFPEEIIAHAVWLYYRFTLSYRDVQELLFERGIDVTYEACTAPHLSSGKERRTGAIVVVSFKLPGRPVAQSGMQVMLVVRGDPSAQGTD